MLRPWQWLPAKLSHELFPLFVDLYAELTSAQNCEWQSFQWQDLRFSNPVGIAGGVDKNADLVDDWRKLGCGFVEVGTVTLRPQSALPDAGVDRNWEQRWLWNRLGFPSAGAMEVAANLSGLREIWNQQKIEPKIPIFVNLGKNRDTSFADAPLDYAELTTWLAPFADALVINVSSPNTQGLRSLQTATGLTPLLVAVQDALAKMNRCVPILVKVSPDLMGDEWEETIETSWSLGVRGFVLTNTTLERQADMKLPTTGGVSGRPLALLSEFALQRVNKILGPQRKAQALLVSAGGVLEVSDVARRLSLGADLVQTYSGLVFDGPWFFRRCASAAASGRMRINTGIPHQ